MINPLAYQEFSEQAKKQVPAGLDTEQWIDNYNRIYCQLLFAACVDNLYLNGYDDAAEQIIKHFRVEQ
jgi:hypothetical protein